MEGATVTGVAISSIVFLIVIQWVSSGVGGFIAGRLRTKWHAVRSDEVFFRDTAHGFLAWALATLIVAGLMSSAITAAIGTIARSATEVTAGAVQGGVQAAASGSAVPGMAGDYFVDRLFRPVTMMPAVPGTASAPTGAADKSEVAVILASAAVKGEVPAADKTYLVQLVASRTGMTEADTTRRIDTVLGEIEAAKTKAKQAADEARKAGVKLSLFMFLALLTGAFIGGAAGAYGGQLRDED